MLALDRRASSTRANRWGLQGHFGISWSPLGVNHVGGHTPVTRRDMMLRSAVRSTEHEPEDTLNNEALLVKTFRTRKPCRPIHGIQLGQIP